MRPLGTYRLAPALPDRLAPLAALARDLRSTWREDVRSLFRDLDPEEWERNGNPVVLLRTADPARLLALASDEPYMERVLAVALALEVEDAALLDTPIPEAKLKLITDAEVAGRAVAGELSWLNLVFPQALFLIPFVRFPGFLWLIAAGLALPKTIARVDSWGTEATT